MSTMEKAKTLLWIITGLGLWLAIVMIAQANAAGSDGFIDPQTRVEGCVAIVEKVRDGTISPTEWLEQNKEEFEDLRLELKKRNYPPAKAKSMMMGMAITMCMERKRFDNTCVTARDEEKRDLQIIRTAPIGECWARPRRAGPTPPPTPTPEPTIAYPAPPPPPSGPIIPPMSRDDIQQFNEDMSIISQDVRIIGDDEGGAKEARFGSCFSYWQSLHYNRSPEARHVLYAVRVARCMYRTNYAILRSRCPWDWNSMLNARCYARF
jgi:hypothetical protein